MDFKGVTVRSTGKGRESRECGVTRGLSSRTQVSTIFIDESGAKNSSGGFFVIGFVKSRATSELRRKVRDVRQRHGHYKEAKFSQITRKNLPFYFDIVELLARSDVRIGGSVYDAHRHFRDVDPTWLTQARMAGQLVLGKVNKNEVVNVFFDVVETPRGESVAQRVRDRVNGVLGVRAVIAAYDLDSTSTDLLQLADIVAGAIAHECHREADGGPSSPSSPKGQVVARLRRAFGLDSLADVRNDRVNILTMAAQPRALPGLDL